MSDPQFSDDYQSWERGMESREFDRLDLNVKGFIFFYSTSKRHHSCVTQTY